MPDDDYHTPGGGLKLKGSKPLGIKKKKKKPSATSTPSRDKELQKAAEAAGEDASSSSRRPTDDDADIDLRSLEQRDPNDGKTAAERAAEEMRRKRVRVFPFSFPITPRPRCSFGNASGRMKFVERIPYLHFYFFLSAR